MLNHFVNPFLSKGNWYKGNLHCHTANSDGRLAPREMVERYREAGFDFLCLTDHYRLSLLEGVQRPLLIPGEELDCGQEMGRTFHIVAVGIKEEIPRPLSYPDADPQDLIDAIRAQDGIAFLAHPYWSSLDTTALLALEGITGLEVYNASCQLECAKGLSAVHWDGLLQEGRNLFGTAVDDSHADPDPSRPDATAAGWVMVKAPELSADAVLEALKRGCFYSSQGPEILTVSVAGRSVRVASSPVKSIGFLGQNGSGRVFTAPEGQLLNTAAWEIPPHQRYLRIQCSDEKGRTAWSNAVQ